MFDMAPPRPMCAYCMLLAEDPHTLIEVEIPGTVYPPDREKVEPSQLAHRYWESLRPQKFYMDRRPVGVTASTRVAGTDVCLGHVLVAMERAGLKPVR